METITKENKITEFVYKDKYKHRQVPIFTDNAVVFHVDEGLQSLIQLCWDFRIVTFLSCQDNGHDRSWILFDLHSWQRLSHIALNFVDEELYSFLTEHCAVYLISKEGEHFDQDGDSWIKGQDLEWAASVRFDKQMIPLFKKMVSKALHEYED